MKLLLTPFILTLALTVLTQAKQVFKSTSVVQIHPAIIAISPIGNTGETNPGTLLTRNYMENEFESIVASETLKIAAQTLKIDLTKDKNALKNLKEKITIKPVRGTDFIQITADGATQKEATRITNAVTDAYIKRRTTAEKEKATQALATLDNELVAQSKLVAQQRKELTDLIQKFGIPYVEGTEPPSAEVMLVPTAETALKTLNNAKPEDKLAIAAAIQIPENPVTPLYNEYHMALEKLDYLGQAHGRKHPKIVAARKTVNEARSKAHQATGKLPALLQKQMSNLRVAIPQLKTDNSVALSLRQHNYNMAKENYEQTRAMLREMKIQQQEARVLFKMPRSPVTIHERAK